MPVGRAEQTWLIATYLVLAALGALLGVLGSFLVPQRLFGGVEGISVLVALAGNLATGLIGGVGTSTRAGAVAPAIGWVLAVGTLTSVAPGGDVVIPGGLPVDPGVPKAGLAFLLVGLVAAVVPIPLTSRYTERVNTPKSLP